MPEFLEAFNENNHSLGFTQNRRLIHENGHWHRTAQVYILNERGELLCNFRHSSKDVFPDLWDLSIGGHLNPGENYEDCATREMAEELGVSLTPPEMVYAGTISLDGYDTITGLIDREHAGVFVWRTSREASSFDYQRDEITELRFFPLSVLRQNLQFDQPDIPIIPLREKFLQILDLLEERFLNTV